MGKRSSSDVHAGMESGDALVLIYSPDFSKSGIKEQQNNQPTNQATRDNVVG